MDARQAAYDHYSSTKLKYFHSVIKALEHKIVMMEAQDEIRKQEIEELNGELFQLQAEHNRLYCQYYGNERITPVPLLPKHSHKR